MFADPKVGELEAWVESTVDGKRLNEYRVEHRPRKSNRNYPSTVCYLKTVDQSFAIKMKKSASLVSGAKGWRTKCYIDGRGLHETQWKGDKPKVFNRIMETENGLLYSSAMSFAPLNTTDDENRVDIDEETLKRLGTIEIILQYGEWTRTHQMKGMNTTSLLDCTVHEKSKKMGYTVKTSDRQPIQDYVCHSVRFKPHRDGEYFYRFVFHYLPRAVLTHIKIIEDPEEKRIVLQAAAILKRRQQTHSLADKNSKQKQCPLNAIAEEEPKKRKLSPELSESHKVGVKEQPGQPNRRRCEKPAHKGYQRARKTTRQF
ncbi:hypothetical protein CI109_100902 [Kwoniella shandongensis]|uniref:DUF7918 domain-containing protein n=1 Tax=Kwoniella shandongensis TaxID=1734106 RepID=A0A5M6C476_9TREE|nr:uncharacterized protein CI109_001369 [Kwoniella shandongensis]KAA5529967.1 hypothetical protein CI109_001369 [Kwoniella shandongensis]